MEDGPAKKEKKKKKKKRHTQKRERSPYMRKSSHTKQ